MQQADDADDEACGAAELDDTDDGGGRLMELVEAVVRVAVAAPMLTLGAVWFAAARWSRRVAPNAMWIIAPVMGLVWLHKNRKDLRAVVIVVAVLLVGMVWAVLLLAVPQVRFAVAVAIPAGGFFGWLWWSATNYPALDPVTATRYHFAVGRHRRVLTDAVHASAGEGAKVVPGSVKALPDGTVEAEVIGAAGRSHDETLALLRETLAESVLAVSGRAFRSASVVGTGAKGRVRIRCLTVDPYEQTIRLSDLGGDS